MLLNPFEQLNNILPVNNGFLKSRSITPSIPIITGVTTPIQADVSQTIHIMGMYFGDPTAGANDTVQICQNGGGYCTSVSAQLLDDADILASVTLSAGDYTAYVFSNGSAGSGFSGAPGGTGERNGADLEVEATSAAPAPVITALQSHTKSSTALSNQCPALSWPVFRFQKLSTKRPVA